MKRNWEIIRTILFRVEECTLPADILRLSDFQEFKAEEISYHMRLLLEAGLVRGEMNRTIGSSVKNFTVCGLTWDGHEFLDSIRSSKVWEKTKDTFIAEGISMTFELVQKLAHKVAAAVLGNTL